MIWHVLGSSTTSKFQRKSLDLTIDGQDWAQTAIKLPIWAIYSHKNVIYLTFWSYLASCEFSNFWECDMMRFRSELGNNGPTVLIVVWSKIFSNNAKFQEPKYKGSVLKSLFSNLTHQRKLDFKVLNISLWQILTMRTIAFWGQIRVK